MRRVFLTVFVVATALAAVSFAQATGDPPPASSSLERSFRSGGRIFMELSAGEYRITGSTADRVRLDWSVRESAQLRHVHVRADINGGDARLITSGPNNFRVGIEVPTRADLYVRLTAGELTIAGIEGNKDVELHAGEVTIDVGRAEDYNRVDGAVWAGELHASPFRVRKEGLFRSFDWRGSGRYRLHAHLKAGELRLTARN